MGEKLLMKGNEALAEAAIRAGCRFFYGYPITPQNEVPEYMARRMPEVNGCFLQAESEVAASQMVLGSAAAGARVMTSSSSPGVSLKQEGLSYIAACELPCVVVNMVRGGPGLGGIAPAQSDYFQATKGGGHGDYRLIVLGPGTVQELVDLTYQAFDIADRYRNPVMILGDGIMGQMMEPVDLPEMREAPPVGAGKPWAVTGCAGREPNLVNSLYLEVPRLEQHNRKLQAKYREIEAREVRFEEYLAEDAEVVVAAYGTVSRIARVAVDRARAEGMKVGMIRPVSLWPFPYQAFRRRAETAGAFLVVEMSMGQMVEDVRLGVEGRAPVRFYGRAGGAVPTPRELLEQIREVGACVNPSQAAARRREVALA